MVKEKKSKRDSNGKFASAQPNNPDCEPATKAYVKCIARTVRSDCIQRCKNGFVFSNSPIWGEWTCMIGLALAMAAGFAAVFHICGDMIFMIGLAASVMIVVGLDINNAATNTRVIYDKYCEDVPSSIKKYEAPECKKKECE